MEILTKYEKWFDFFLAYLWEGINAHPKLHFPPHQKSTDVKPGWP